MRQLKVKDHSCEIPDAFNDEITSCFAKYTEKIEDREFQTPANATLLGCTGESYGNLASTDGTFSGNGSSSCNNATANAWRYRTEADLRSSWCVSKPASTTGASTPAS